MPIKSYLYYHDQDKTALENLQSVPGFSAILKKFINFAYENNLHNSNMTSNIRLGPKQFPEIYKLLPPICETLGIDEPELYLEMDSTPNAYTYGDTTCFVTLTSGLVEALDEEEVKAVLAHECGHIACHHVLYHSMGGLILNNAPDFILTDVIKAYLQKWIRCSELSADRAAAICTGGYHSLVKSLLTLSGKTSITNKINVDLYIEQASQSDNIRNNSFLENFLQMLSDSDRDHPITAVRAVELKRWCDTNQFKRLMNISSGIKNGTICSFCGSTVQPSWVFCKKCGNKRRT